MQPSLDQFFAELIGAYSIDWAALSVPFGTESGVVCGTNPPYTASDFLAFHPKFGGTPAQVTGTLTTDSDTVTSASNLPALSVGQLIVGNEIPSGALITAIDTMANTITLSAKATASGTMLLKVYTCPLVPLPVINAYIALANASLMQARWCDTWQLAVGWYVAHFLTLWLESDGDLYSMPGQAAAAGLQRGIQVSKSVGDVSVSYQAIEGLADFGAWSLTSYGSQLATFAKAIGSGPIYVR